MRCFNEVVGGVEGKGGRGDGGGGGTIWAHVTTAASLQLPLPESKYFMQARNAILVKWFVLVGLFWLGQETRYFSALVGRFYFG